MSTIQIHIPDGNLTSDPELRFTPSGQAVASLTIAVTPRTRNAAGEWVDGETTFLRGSVWGQYAENVAESLSKGDRVTATGTLRARTFQTREGESRTVFEATFATVAPDLRFATARPQRASRTSASAGTDEYQAQAQALHAVRSQLGATPVDAAY